MIASKSIMVRATAMPRSYQQLHQKYHEAKKHHTPQKFLDHYNQVYAPKITTEESVLEFLSMRIAYMDLKKGFNIKTYINKAIISQGIEDDYDRSYTVEDKLVDFNHGLTAFLLLPNNPNKRSIIIIRGVSLLPEMLQFLNGSIINGVLMLLGMALLPQHTMWHAYIICLSEIILLIDTLIKLKQTMKQPTGLKAAFDPLGIAHQATEANRHIFEAWQNSSSGTTFIGHSKGGLVVARLKKSYSHKSHGLCYSAPGPDKKSAPGINTDHNNMRIIYNPDDILTSAGAEPLSVPHQITPNITSRIQSIYRMSVHSSTFLVEAELNNQIQHELPKPGKHKRWFSIENIRLLIAYAYQAITYIRQKFQ